MKQLADILGPLSKPSKMPGLAWGIPATMCKTGGKLRKIPGTVCHDCYAMKGRYAFHTVREAGMRRLRAYYEVDGWADWMVEYIGRAMKKKPPYFRWFDSGDLQSLTMAEDIFEICRRLPHIRFWMPTKEARFANMCNAECPSNLVIRISDTKIDQSWGSNPPKYANSGVMEATKPEWGLLVTHGRRRPNEVFCPAPLQDNSCGDCRECWEPSLNRVIYRKH